MRRLLAVVATLLLATLPTTPLHAQRRVDPGTVIEGRVAVRVYVTLADDAVPYHPLPTYALRFYRLGGDSVSLRTDDAGALTTVLEPGEYRLVSLRPYEWRGRRYAWSLPVVVRAGMPAIDLTAQNAVVTAGPLAALPSGASGVAGAVDPLLGAPRALRSPKDGTLGVLLSFLLTGGGQMYAGKPGKGIGLLLLSVGAVAGGAAATDCGDYYDEGECDVGPLAAGVGIAIGTWIYSMVSAPGDVREYNARHGLAATLEHVQPHVAARADGSGQVGLAIALGRR